MKINRPIHERCGTSREICGCNRWPGLPQSQLLRSAWIVMAALLAILLAAFTALGDPAEPRELPMAHDEYVYMIRFSPDGTTLATAAGDNVARLWNWSKRSLLHTLEHEAAVYAAVFSPAGDLLATGSGDGHVTLWKPSDGRQVAQQQEHADAVYCLSFSPNGARLASIGGDGKKGDTQCRIWSVPSLNIARVLPGHERPAYGVLFGPRVGPACDTLLTSGGDKLIHVYGRQTGKRRTLRGHTSDVYRCCFSTNGEQLATTSQDGSVRLWDVATGKLLKTLFQSKDPTYDVAYSRDGKILAAVGDDGFVRFWNTMTYELLVESKTDKEGLYSVAFTPEQTHVITGGVRGELHECPVPHTGAKRRVRRSTFDQKTIDAIRP